MEKTHPCFWGPPWRTVGNKKRKLLHRTKAAKEPPFFNVEKKGLKNQESIFQALLMLHASFPLRTSKNRFLFFLAHHREQF